jgi:hypothetical protein
MFRARSGWTYVTFGLPAALIVIDGGVQQRR